MHHKVVLITGSTQGIGKATALEFYRQGAKVVFTGKSSAKLKSLQKLKLDAGRCCYVAADLRSEAGCRKLVSSVLRRWGRIDVLVNNCGGLQRTGQFMDLADKDWRESFDLNFLTAVRMTKLVIVNMRKIGEGRIINLASLTALQPGSFNPHYSTMKMALLNLSKYLAGYLAQDHITVNAITPGNIDTEGWHEYLLSKAHQEGVPLKVVRESEEKRVIAGIPLKRFGLPEEVGEIISFLCSPAGRYITGANLVVDGGKSKGIY